MPVSQDCVLSLAHAVVFVFDKIETGTLSPIFVSAEGIRLFLRMLFRARTPEMRDFAATLMAGAILAMIIAIGASPVPRIVSSELLRCVAPKARVATLHANGTGAFPAAAVLSETA